MIDTGTDKLKAHVDGGVGFVTFNHPERRNAVSLEMWSALGNVMEAFNADDEVRVIVLTGAGGKAFASGADISEFEAKRASAEQRQSYGEVSGRGLRALHRCPKPVLAMIRGYCIGGGLVIALSADVRFATTGSKFGIPAAKLGLGYDYSGVAALARLVGPARAADMLFSARHLEASEALQCGLIEFTVEDAELESRVTDYARRIAGNAPLTLRAVKASLQTYARATQQADVTEVERLIRLCYESEDYREGRRAFLEKRAPEFRGR
jgi:enoyl-CoA hydratase/carnithine racemase